MGHEYPVRGVSDMGRREGVEFFADGMLLPGDGVAAGRVRRLLIYR